MACVSKIWASLRRTTDVCIYSHLLQSCQLLWSVGLTACEHPRRMPKWWLGILCKLHWPVHLAICRWRPYGHILILIHHKLGALVKNLVQLIDWFIGIASNNCDRSMVNDESMPVITRILSALFLVVMIRLEGWSKTSSIDRAKVQA